MPAWRQADLSTGRWHTGALATGFPDLNLRLAELLDDLGMPGTLLPSVLAAATWDFVVNVRSRDYDDRQALVDYVVRSPETASSVPGLVDDRWPAGANARRQRVAAR